MASASRVDSQTPRWAGVTRGDLALPVLGMEQRTEGPEVLQPALFSSLPVRCCFLRSSSHPSSGKDGVHDRFLLDMKSVAICVVSLQTECRPLKHFSLQTYYN